MATEFRKTPHPAIPEVYLYKRKDADDAPWQYSFYVSEAMNNGGKAKNHRKSTRTNDIAKAMQVGAMAYLAIKNATDDGEQVTLSGMPTVNDAYEKLQQSYRVRIASKKVRPSTLENLEKYYDRELAGYFGNREVRKITNSMWNDFLADLVARKPHLSPDTIRLTKGALRRVLKFASREGWIDAAPDFHDDFNRGVTDSRRVWFNWAEQHRLLSILDENVRTKARKTDLYSAESLRDFCHMMLYNGIRPGELRIVRFCDISLVSEKDDSGKRFSVTQIDIPHVPGAKVGGRTTTGVKGSGEAFQRILKRRGGKNNSTELLFDENNTSKFRALLEEYNLRFDKDEKKRDFESLRHSFICNRLLELEPVGMIADNCGTSPHVIRKHYAKHINIKADSKKYAKFKARLKDKELLQKEREAQPY